MLALVLDGQISPEVARQVSAKRPHITLTSLHLWEAGKLLHTEDAVILETLAGAGLTLVTYDQKTIPPVLWDFAVAERQHGGIVFIDEKTIAQNDIGGLVNALIRLWDTYSEADWTNRVLHLRRP
jgi:hypothetical protein